MTAAMLPNLVLQLREEFILLLTTLEGANTTLNHTYLVELIFTLVNFDAFLRPEERDVFMRASDKLLGDLINELKRIREIRKRLEENKVFLTEIIKRCALLHDICEEKLDKNYELAASLLHNDNKRLNSAKSDPNVNPSGVIPPRAHMTTHSSDGSFSDIKQRPCSAAQAHISQYTTAIHRNFPQGLLPTANAFDNASMQNNLVYNMMFATYQATKESFRGSVARQFASGLSIEKSNFTGTAQSCPDKATSNVYTNPKRDDITGSTLPRQYLEPLPFNLVSNAANADQMHSNFSGYALSDDRFLAALCDSSFFADFGKLQGKGGDASLTLMESCVFSMGNAWEKCLWDFLNGVAFVDDLLLVDALLSMHSDLPLASDRNTRGNNLDVLTTPQKFPGVLMNFVGQQSTSPISPHLLVAEAAAAAANTSTAVWGKTNSFNVTNSIPKVWKPSSSEATYGLLSVLGGVEPVRWEFWAVMQAVFTVLMEELLGKRPSDKSDALGTKNVAADDGHLGGRNENLHQPREGKHLVNNARSERKDVRNSQYVHSSEMLRERLESKGCSPFDQDLSTSVPVNDEYGTTTASVHISGSGIAHQTDPIGGVHPPSTAALGLLKNVFCPSLCCYAVGAQNFMSAAPLLATRAATTAFASTVSTAVASSAEVPPRLQAPEADTVFEPNHPSETPDAMPGPSSGQDQNMCENIGKMVTRTCSHSSMDSFNSLPHHSYTSLTIPASPTLSLNPGLFTFSTDAGILTENSDDDASHKNVNIRPVDVLVHAFITAIRSQLEQCTPISQCSDALDGAYEKIETTSPHKDQTHQVMKEHVHETTPTMAQDTGSRSLPSLHIGSCHAVGDLKGLADRDQTTGASANYVKRGCSASTGPTVCGLGCGLPSLHGAQRERTRSGISLVSSMSGVLVKLLDDINASITTTRSMEDQLEGEVTLLTFRVVSTIVDWLIPAVYLVDMRIWLFYRKWLCGLYRFLQQEGLLERFSSMLNRRVGSCMVSPDENLDASFAVKETNEPEMEGIERPLDEHEGCSDSQGNPNLHHKANSVGETTPKPLTTSEKEVFQDSLPANASHIKFNSKHSKPKNYSAQSEPCCIASDGNDFKSLHSAKLKRSKKQRSAQQQPPPPPPQPSEKKPERSSRSISNPIKTDIFSPGSTTRQSHLKISSKAVSTAERPTEHEGLGTRPAVSLRVTPTLHSKVHEQHHLHKPHHQQALSRKKSRNTAETRISRPLSNLLKPLAKSGTKGKARDPVNNGDPSTSEQSIELSVALTSSVHTDTWLDSRDAVQLTKKSTNFFWQSDPTALVVPGCGLLLRQQIQRGYPWACSRQVETSVGRSKAGLPETALAAAATAALLDKGTKMPFPRNHMLTRLIAAMVRGMETEAVRSLLNAFTGPARDPPSRFAKDGAGEAQKIDDHESRATKPLTSRDYDTRRISSDTDTANRPIHFQHMNLATTQNSLSLPNSPASRHFDGATVFTPLVEAYPGVNFPAVFTGHEKSGPVGETSAGIRAPRPALNQGEGPGLVHHHRFRYPVIWDYDDVVTLYMNTLHDAEAMLSPHDPIRAALVENTVGYMCLESKNLRLALEILEHYLDDVSEERVQEPVTKLVALGRADGTVAVSAGPKGTPLSARPTLGDPRTSPKPLINQPSLATRKPISPLIADPSASRPFSLTFPFPNKFESDSTTLANSGPTMAENFGHFPTPAPSTQPKQLQEVPQVVPSWETTVERDQFIYILSHLRRAHEELQRRVDVV
ncbi:unnamed protein product [Phytomonas sp. EM1]|nr:unnamed protein product [Phytomonas sp. EM1]|eukprot:CCW61258.1 unnamed protein product [Phytomonas sp. isolate EM1]